MIENKTNLLKNWQVWGNQGIVVLSGTIFNDIKKRFLDGTPITTSRVLKADFVNGVVETKNSVYHLDLGEQNG